MLFNNLTAVTLNVEAYVHGLMLLPVGGGRGTAETLKTTKLFCRNRPGRSRKQLKTSRVRVEIP